MTGDFTPAYDNSDPWDAGVLTIADDADGTMIIANGSQVTSGRSTITDAVGTAGSVVVTGAGSTWTAISESGGSGLNVGERGSGTLEILDQAQVISDGVEIGFSDGSSGLVRVNGPGSLLQINRNDSSSTFGGNIEVGLRFLGGSGTLTVENGGRVENSNTTIDSDSGATVDGPGSIWSNEFDFELNGTATLDILNGALVNVGRDTFTGNGISFSNGTLNTNSILFSPNSLAGTGVVNTNGLVGDLDLVFDSSNGLQKQFVFNSQPGQNITMNLDMSTADIGLLGAGYRGVGSLRIADGLKIKSRSGEIGYGGDSNGTATVTGAGSIWDLGSGRIRVGGSGAGQLRIDNGGKVINGQAIMGGFFSVPGGEVIVTGINSTWQNESLALVAGSLRVQNQGLVTISESAVVSDVATLHGVGTRLIVSGELTILGSEAALNIQSGAFIASAGASIGADNSGSVTVSGSGSSWVNIGDLLVGAFGGDGVLNMTAGTFVSSDNVFIDFDSRFGRREGTLNQGGGTLSINGGTLSATLPDQYNLLGGRLENVGLIDLGGVFDQVSGVLAPIGVTNIDGGYAITDAALTIELHGSGIAGEDFDQVSVAGDVTLSSTSQLNLILEYAPSVGDEFLILENDGTGAISGVFAQGSSVIANFNGNPYEFAINYSGGSGNDITLTSMVYVPKLGDCNQDGVVNFLDIEPFISILAVGGYLEEADTNQDGLVNFLDIGPFIALLSSQG